MKKTLIFLLVMVLIVPCFSLFVSAADLVNVAEGKSYTVDIGDGTPGYSYPSPDDGSGFGDGPNAIRQRLTDGVIATDDGGLAGAIGAQATTKAIYVIDLGSVVTGITRFNMDMYSYADWGISESISVEYALSTDGTTYTTVGTVLLADAVNKVASGWVGDDFILNITTAQSARYVKITASANNYVWSSEMQVFADTTTSDESNSDLSNVTSDVTSNVTSNVSIGDVVSDNSIESTNSEIVNTGDFGNYAIFGVIVVLAIGCIYIVSRKRIHNN